MLEIRNQKMSPDSSSGYIKIVKAEFIEEKVVKSYFYRDAKDFYMYMITAAAWIEGYNYANQHE